MLQDDGDIIRGLGFVALYAAYLEEHIDNLLQMLDPVWPYDQKKKRSISEKIKHARKVVKRLDGQKFSDLVKDLGTCIGLFEDRNEIIHGRIYGVTFNRPDSLRSGRSNIPDREVTSEEL
jgi:hypothetical protein